MGLLSDQGKFAIFTCRNCADDVEYTYHCGSTMALIMRREVAYWICKACDHVREFDHACSHPDELNL
ncbi:MAG: hypothetical protein ACXAE3_01510 [Candidatus Kariarchaeaceae archaeon]